MTQGYRVSLDLADFTNNSQIRRFSLRQYSVPFCVVFTEANDPDDAANTVLNDLLTLLMDQNADVWTRILCRKIRRRMKITKIKAVQ